MNISLLMRCIATLVLVILYATAPWHLVVEFGRQNATATVTIALTSFCFLFVWGIRYWLEAYRMEIDPYPQVAVSDRKTVSDWLTLGDLSVGAALAILFGFFQAIRSTDPENLGLSDGGTFAVIGGGILFIVFFYFYVVDHFDRRV